MQKLFDRLTSAALVLAAAAVCALCGTPRQFDEPDVCESAAAELGSDADTADDGEPQPTDDDGEPVAQDDDDDEDNLTYAFYVALPLPSDSALGVPLPPSIALVAPWQMKAQAQTKERRNG